MRGPPPNWRSAVIRFWRFLVGGDDTDRPAGGCPAEANLEDPRQLDAMLAARASARGDVVITILGPTSGTRAIRMEEEMGEAFVLKTLWECPLELGSKQ